MLWRRMKEWARYHCCSGSQGSTCRLCGSASSSSGTSCMQRWLDEDCDSTVQPHIPYHWYRDRPGGEKERFTVIHSFIQGLWAVPAHLTENKPTKPSKKRWVAEMQVGMLHCNHLSSLEDYTAGEEVSAGKIREIQLDPLWVHLLLPQTCICTRELIFLWLQVSHS